MRTDVSILARLLAGAIDTVPCLQAFDGEVGVELGSEHQNVAQ
jgi:hypothetical protein